VRKYIFHIIVPLLIGVFIYVFWRTTRINIFHWMGSPAAELINQIQNISFFKSIHLPDWVLFSLPDALWLYALTTLLIFIWDKKVDKNSLPWLLLCPLLAFASEIGQGLKIVPGTYDNIDMFAYLISTLGAYAHVLYKNPTFQFKTFNLKKT